MFGLFGKKSSKSDSVALCAALAANATIDVVLENGNYKAFLIKVAADGSSLADHFKYPEAQSAIVSAIEERIERREYDDSSDGIEMVREMREMTGWKPNTNIVRAVVGRAGKPLFSWNPSVKA